MVLDPTAKKKDGAETQPGQEALQIGSEQTSDAEQLTSKIEEGKQYAGADVKKMVGDILSADGRVQKDRADKAELEVTRLTGVANTLTTQFNTVSSQVANLVKAQDDAEADAIKEDPVALGSLRARQANSREALKLEGVHNTQEARETKQNERDTTLNTRETGINIKLVAMAADVDEKALANLVPDGDPVRLTNAANLLKGQAAIEIDPLTGKPKPVALTNIPASVQSAGVETRGVAEVMLENAKKK